MTGTEIPVTAVETSASEATSVTVFSVLWPVHLEKVSVMGVQIQTLTQML